jgi:glycosyltransferase involved in cell wall biosynthesis
MRIAQIAPLYEAVPPQGYGGTERVVDGLTRELLRCGHDVTLFASADSRTPAQLVPCAPRALRLNECAGHGVAYTVAQLGKVSRLSREFDLIHSHIDYYGFPFARTLSTPVVTTLHGRLDLPELGPVFREFGEAPVIAISDAQRISLAAANWVGVVHNGIDLTHFTLREDRGQYLAFLGRISPEKRPDLAIAIARAVGLPLRIAAKVDPVDRAYFAEVIEPLFEAPSVEFIGELNEHDKDEFLGNAYAYLFPIDWPEPFGITMVEALACGTPVIAMRRGAVPEVLIDGTTGYICGSVPEMIQAVAKIPSIDRRACRAHVAERFSVGVMGANYQAIYEDVLGRRALATTGPDGDALETPAAAGAHTG